MKKHFSYKLLLAITLIIFGCKRNRPPQIPIISAPSTGNTNVPVDFMISTTDPNKDEVAYQLSCGDGTRDTTWTAYFPSGQSVPITHTYSKPGNYSAMAKAKDTKEKESDWSNPHQISISSQAPNVPTLPSGPTSGRINVAYDFSTSTTDPDGDSVAYQFDWGDNSDTTWTQYYPGGLTVSQSHTFTSIDTFKIKVKAKDKHNIESGWSPSHTIIISVAGEWITIMSEDFEGDFPGATWTLYGTPTWDDENYRPYQGSWSGWCAGSTMNPPGPYAPDMNAWMVYGPFSLVDASDAFLSFYRWVETEGGYDSLFFGASINGTNFYGYFISGSRQYWYDDWLDLTDVPVLGNLCGRSQVWIGFGFISDGSFQYEGAYLDNILLEEYVGTKASGKPRVSLKDITPNLNRHIIPGKMTIPHSDRKK